MADIMWRVGDLTMCQRHQILNLKKAAKGMSGKKQSNPTDIHVGSRVRLRRMMIGMSQEKLGESLGITFQQVQKYEKGMNRIGASRLQNIASSLNVPISYFFEGSPDSDQCASSEGEGSATQVVEFLSTAEGLQLNKAFSKVTNPKIRRRIVDLVASIADAETILPDA